MFAVALGSTDSTRLLIQKCSALNFKQIATA